jgi:hypothetical protein
MASNNEEMPNFNTPTEDPSVENGDLMDASFVASEQPRNVNKTTLVLLLVAAMGGAGLYFMHLRSGPKPANAAAKESAEAGKAITQFLSAGGTNIKAMEELLKNTEKVVQKFLTYPSVTQVPLTSLQTNPFRLSIAKSDSPQSNAQETKRREEERQAAIKAVQSLTLQSVIVSADRKACLINNTLYKESQQVNGFTIESIRPGSVIVRNGAYRFELKMQK